MEGDVAEKDNVLLTLCCSKNSYNQENGEGGGGGIYMIISDPLSSRLRVDFWPPSPSGSETWGRRMRFGMSMKVSLPDKRTVSGGKKGGQKLGGVCGQPHWSVLAFFGPVALASGEVPGLLGAGFAEAASLPDSWSHRT